MCRRAAMSSAFVSVAFSVLFFGCGGNQTLSPSPAAAEHMYVIEGTSVPNQPAVALKFDLPVTAASVPKVVLNPGPVVSAEDNSGNAAGVGGLGVSVFKEH